MMLPLQTAGRSSLSATSGIYKHLCRHNFADLAPQDTRTTANAQLPLAGPSLGLPIPPLILNLELGFDHAKLQGDKGVLDLATRPGDLRVIGQSVELYHSVSRFKHLCATEGRPKSTEAFSQASSASFTAESARQTQVHESNNAIHRLMPRDRTIHFSMDRSSFRRHGVPDEMVDMVIASAEAIASHIEKQGLGINFAYKPGSDSPAIFDMRYDPGLGENTLAKSFFPSDERTGWKLGISQTVFTSQYFLYHMPNILAHEFAHILGLRHWNSHTHEPELRSFHWPNTIFESKRSIMVTDVDLEYMLFSEEDFRVIREMYSFPNGYVFAGREIINVYP